MAKLSNFATNILTGLHTLMDDTKIRLNEKEFTILQMIAAGKTSDQIAAEMCLALPTIKWYRKRLRSKFDVGTTVQMISKAIQLQIL